MAKQKLYGNHSEPCCETCALGRRTSDGKTVLCRRVGAVPLYHHCRHFVYDPLRRTPHRDRAPEIPDASAFSLDEVASPETTVSAQSEDSAALLERLRQYLRDTEAPDIADILAMLSEAPTDETEEEEEESETLPDEEQPREMTQEDQRVLDEIEETLAENDVQTEPEETTVDIFEDLERFDPDDLSSKRAAFQPLDFELPDEEEEEETLQDPRFEELAGRLDATATLMLDDFSDHDDELLTSDDLIFLSAAALRDDLDGEEELFLNADGSIGAKKR